ncbi:MAG: substrate-binding periplasmic protein, partial [Alphaproteobacteria bacterium]
SASKKPDRKKYLLYPQMPLHELKYVFVTKPDDKIRQSWEQNMDLSVIPDPIGIPLGFSIAEKLRRDTKARIYEGAKDDEQNLQLLLKDRVNSIVIESIVAKWAVNANNASDKVQILDKRPYTKDGKRYYITVSKKYGGNETEAQKLVSEIDHHLKEMQTDGTTQKIVDSYLRSE